MKTGIIILGHGSRSEEANQALCTITDIIKEKMQADMILPAFMEFGTPNIEEAVDQLAENGIEKIVVMPLFLFMGIHLKEDIPAELDKARSKHPDLNIVFTNPLGTDARIADIVIDRIAEAG